MKSKQDSELNFISKYINGKLIIKNDAIVMTTPILMVRFHLINIFHIIVTIHVDNGI